MQGKRNCREEAAEAAGVLRRRSVAGSDVGRRAVNRGHGAEPVRPEVPVGRHHRNSLHPESSINRGRLGTAKSPAASNPRTGQRTRRVPASLDARPWRLRTSLRAAPGSDSAPAAATTKRSSPARSGFRHVGSSATGPCFVEPITESSPTRPAGASGPRWELAWSVSGATSASPYLRPAVAESRSTSRALMLTSGNAADMRWTMGARRVAAVLPQVPTIRGRQLCRGRTG